MRCYLVTAKDGEETLGRRYAGTNALAREARDTLMEQFDVKKKDVAIEDAEIPVAKNDLLGFVNELLAEQDAEPEADEK